MPDDWSLFAACLPGLEPLLCGELKALGIDARPTDGGATFAGDRETVLQAHLHLGTASQLTARLASFTCHHLRELERRALPLPWGDWLRSDVPVVVKATAKKSKLYHTGAIEERIGKAIHSATGAPIATTAGDDDGLDAVRIAVRIDRDRVTVSLATSDSPMHRRGYRLATAKAPLREDLAHALLLAARFDADEALLDPFCGSGTIAIEAARMACGIPPGILRPTPLLRTAIDLQPRWDQLVAAASPSAPTAEILAGDRDAGAVESARANAERGGCAAHLSLLETAISAQPWLAEHPEQRPERGLLATNPPFGLRVGGNRDLAPLYQTLGHRARRLGPGWRVALLVHDPRLARRTGLPLRQMLATRHGGLHISVLVGPSAE